ncbi:MAG: hypothetical protein ACOYXB_05080 [Bacteroidota bacterium]
MKNTILSIVKITLLLLVVFVNQSCTEMNGPDDTPLITEKGDAVGTMSSAVIGPAGGTMSSGDQLITVTIPEGALSEETEISIQPITNNAPLGIANGFRLLPEGTVFSKPVTLTFSYTNDMLDGVPEDFLWIVTQADDGSWNALLKSEINKTTRTVTVETSHFSDWALGKFIDFTLVPSSYTLKKGESITLQLSGFSRDKQLTEDDDLVPLVPINSDGDDLVPLTPIPATEERLMDFRVKGWTLNGASAPVNNSGGKLTANGGMAVYTAPDKRPDINPVAVTVSLEASDEAGSKSSWMVTANISVIESDYYLLVTVDGVEYEYFEYGFNGSVPPDPANLSIVNCAVTNGSLEIAASTIKNSIELADAFSLDFENVTETGRQLTGFYEDGEDDMTFQFGSGNAYSLSYARYSYDEVHDICNTEYLSADVVVNIISYNTETSVVRGYFSGKLYDNESADWEQCKSPEEHTVDGEFNLYMAAK